MSKNKKAILITLSIFVIVILSFLSYKKWEQQYNISFSQIEEHRVNSFFNVLLVQYFREYYEYPISLDETHPDKLDEEYEAWRLNFFIDFLSHGQKGDILYVPIYDKENKKRIGGAILSAGIDGKLNNKIGVKDTVYAEEFFKKISVYNSKKFSNSMIIDPPKVSDFSIKDRLFGTKDYLIEVITPGLLTFDSTLLKYDRIIDKRRFSFPFELGEPFLEKIKASDE